MSTRQAVKFLRQIANLDRLEPMPQSQRLCPHSGTAVQVHFLGEQSRTGTRTDPTGEVIHRQRSDSDDPTCDPFDEAVEFFERPT